MRALPKRPGKIGSYFSLMSLLAMFMFFVLGLPGFLITTAGRVFVVVWACTAIIAFTAHAMHMVPEQRPYISQLAERWQGKKAKHIAKTSKDVHVMRQY